MTAVTAKIPPDEIKREAAKRRLSELADLAPRSIAAHAALFHKTSDGRPVIPARHHLEWCKFAHDVAHNRWIVVVCPPGYAKSTWWSVIYPAWRIGQTAGRIRIGLISNTANLTWGFVNSIRRTIEDPNYRAVYGIGPDPKRWSQSQFWTEGSIDPANATVLAAGIGGPVQGKRFDEIICDDLTTWEDARSDATMEGQRHFLRALLLKRFEPGMGPPNGSGRMIVAMTRWSERDLVPTLEEIGFKVITMPALGYWDAVRDDSGRLLEWGVEPLWPEVETREALEAERADDEITFELVKQGNPKVVGGDMFNLDALNRVDVNVRDPRFRETFPEIIQFVDTAGGKDRRRGDFFVDATLGIRVRDDREEVWVLDIERGRYPAPDQERKVTVEGDEWRPHLILIEDRNEGTALFQNMVEYTRLPIKPYMPERDKEWRAIGFANKLNSGGVYVPKGAHWLRAFEMEMAAFPRGPHDDQVDAVSGAFNHTGGGGPRVRMLRSPGPGSRRRRL